MSHAPLQLRAFFHAPSPDITPFFRALSEHPGVSLRMVYDRPRRENKPWANAREGLDSVVLSDEGAPALERELEAPADAWIVGESVWDRRTRAIARRLSRRGVPAVLLCERICFDRQRFEPDPGLRRRWVDPVVKRLLVPRLLRRFPIIASIGGWAAEQHRALHPRARVVETSYVADLDPARGVERTHHADGVVRLGYWGQLIQRKGLDTFFESAAPLLRGRSDWELRIGGDGPDRARLADLAERLGLASRIRWLGFLSQEEIRERILARADLTVFPSHFDGWAMTVPESLAAGVPVLSAPAVGASHDLLREGENGWIRAPERFPEVLREVLERPELVREMRGRSRASVADYTPRSVAGRFVADLRRVLDDLPGAGGRSQS
jgi:glycosyltransferase involved in cell wall biosynthesis